MRVHLIIGTAMLLANAAAADIPSRACQNSKKPEDTIAACTSDLKQQAPPQDRAVTLTVRAKAYEELGSDDAAKADYEDAVALAPGFITWFNRAQFRLDSGMFDAAAQDFSQAISLYDSVHGHGIATAQYQEAHLQRGHALRRAEHYAEALEDYSWVIENDSRNLSAYTQRAFCYSHLGRLDEDIADLNQTMKLNGIDAVSLYNRGLAYVRKNDDAAALADFNETLKRGPGMAVAYVARGGVMERAHQQAKALEDYRMATRLDPKLPSAAAALARLEP